ncbi:MAG: hypothetical protein HYX26_04450 [Acidobacteriales bacterium]|nr:hypothetical protein [Terriglobales bacterium]
MRLKTIIFNSGVPLVLLVGLGCSNRTLKKEDLVGEWRLVIGSDCRERQFALESLVLSENGSMTQRMKTNAGVINEFSDENWKYLGENIVVLEGRRDFSGVRGESYKRGGEVLDLVSDPPTILLSPDSDCMYVKAQ